MRKRSVKPADDRQQPFDRALSLLTAVSAAARPISVSDLASECGLPGPTAHRLVMQLKKRGLLKPALGSKKVLIGEAFLRMSVSAIEAAIRGDKPHQILVTLAAEIGEHVQLGVRFDNDVLYVDTARAPRSRTGLHFEQGRRAPIYCTSIGKLFLAEMPEAEFISWLSRTPLPAVTAQTITKPAALRAAVVKVRASGWATSKDEFATGVIGCAVPIRTSERKLIAGLGISVPGALLPFKKLEGFRPKMEKAAAAIAKAVTSD